MRGYAKQQEGLRELRYVVSAATSSGRRPVFEAPTKQAAARAQRNLAKTGSFGRELKLHDSTTYARLAKRYGWAPQRRTRREVMV